MSAERGHDLEALSAERIHDLEALSAERRHDLEAFGSEVTLTALSELVEEILKISGFFTKPVYRESIFEVYWYTKRLNTVRSVV